MPGKERFGFQTLTATRADTPIAGSGKEKEREEEVKAQVMGSKRMMDMFLSSRRRRVAGSEDSAAPAFI